MLDLEFTQTIYDNTVFAAYKSSNPLGTEVICHELGTLLGIFIDEETVPVDSMYKLLSCLKKLHVSYDHLIIIRKVVTNDSVRYTVGFSNSRDTFDVNIVDDVKHPEHYNCMVMLDFLTKEDERHEVHLPS